MLILDKEKDYPTIYLRYLNNKLIYIGESNSFIRSRHSREDIDAGDFDKIRILKAPKDKKRRKYWEAFLICKLLPINQKTSKYLYIVERSNSKESKKSYYKNVTNDEKLNKQNILHAAYLNLEKFNKLMKIYKGN